MQIMFAAMKQGVAVEDSGDDEEDPMILFKQLRLAGITLSRLLNFHY